MPQYIRIETTWLKKLLSEENYTSINYSEDFVYTKIILTNYGRQDKYKAVEFIKSCKETESSCVVPNLDSAWFISYYQLIQFKELCM